MKNYKKRLGQYWIKMKHEIIWSKDAGDELVEIISYMKYKSMGNILQSSR